MLLGDARTFAAHQPHERGNRPEGQWALSDSYMEAQAAQLGLGLAYVPVELVADDLNTVNLSGCCSVTACEWKD